MAHLIEEVSYTKEPHIRSGKRHRLDFVLTCLTIVSILVTGGLGIAYSVMTKRVVTPERDRARAEAVRAAATIDTELKRLPRVIDAIAGDLSSGRVTRAQILERLKSVIDTLPQLAGIGVAYTPYAYDANLRLYAPYYQRTATSTELISLDSLYDYTQSGQQWYEGALKTGRSWSEPSITGTGGNAVVEYSAPFTDGPSQSTKVLGVVHGTMSLSEINELVRSLDLGEYGYGFLVSGKMAVISHPFATKLTQSPLDITSSTAASGTADQIFEAVKHMFAVIQDGHAGDVTDVIDPVTNQPSWVLSQKVPSTGWTVGVVFLKGAIATGEKFRHMQMWLTLAGLASSCLLLITWALRWHNGSIKRLWIAEIVASALLAVAIATLWHQGYGEAVPNPSGETMFANEAGVRKFVIESTRASLKQKGTLPIFVPTGVLLQTLEIVGPNNINVTGYVWQKYARNIPVTVGRGFVLPEAADSQITQVYKHDDEDAEVIGWRVKATIRQSFDYSKYPLDEQDFRLRLRHVDLDNPAMLIPDLDSYQIINPLARLGLEKNFTLPGWQIARTQFSAGASDPSTTFGLATGPRDALSELSFNLVLDRRIIEPIFSNLLPLAVSGFMVFALLVCVKESTRGNVTQILSAYSALFFVVILSELDLRRRLSSSSIMYVEYFYFAMYGAILIVALTTLTNAYTGHFPGLERREHLIPKLLFWPSILIALLAVTLVTFY